MECCKHHRVTLLAAIQEQGAHLQREISTLHVANAGDSSGSVTSGPYGSWTWGGRIHPVPETFHFPT